MPRGCRFTLPRNGARHRRDLALGGHGRHWGFSWHAAWDVFPRQHPAADVAPDRRCAVVGFGCLYDVTGGNRAKLDAQAAFSKFTERFQWHHRRKTTQS